MGRFYRTANTTPVDYMYRINSPLMEKVLSTNEGYITQELDQAAKLSGLTQYNHLAADSDAANQISNEYNTQIDDLTAQINKDLPNWRKYIQPIKNLSRAMQNDYTNGAISKHIANFDKRKADFDNIDKQVELYQKTGGQDKDGNAIGIAPENAAAYKNYYDRKFTGTNYDSKNPNAYNVYKGGTPMGDINIKKFLSEGLDKIKANKSFKYETKADGSEWLLNKETNKMEAITPQKILSIVADNAQNPKLFRYLKERSDIGLMNGVFDKQGNLIAPYSNTKPGQSPEEKAAIQKQQVAIDQIKDFKTKEFLQQRLNAYSDKLKNKEKFDWNDGAEGRPYSSLSPIFRSLVNEYSYSDTEQGNTATNYSKPAVLSNQANQRGMQTQRLGQAWQIHQDTEKTKKAQFDANLGERVREFDLAEAGRNDRAGNKGTSKGTTKSKLQEISDITSVDKFTTHSFANQTTRDINTGKYVPKLSVAGLSSDIDTNKKSLSILDQSLDAINAQLKYVDPNNKAKIQELNLQKSDLQLSKTQAQRELDNTRYYYKKTTEQVLANGDNTGSPLKPEEVSIYKEFEKNGDLDGKKYSAYIDNLRKEYPNRESRRDQVITDLGPSEQVQKALDHLHAFNQARNKVNTNKDEFLSNVRKTQIDSDAIKPNKQESEYLATTILSKTQGLQLLDQNGKTPNIRLDSYQLVKNQEGAKLMDFTAGVLSDYISKNNVKMDVLRVGPTTGAGNGHAVAEVQFDDKNGKIPSDKKFYIVLNGDLEKDISTKYSTSKNPDIAKIGQTMGDGLANSIRKQISPLALDNSLKAGNKEHTINITVPDWNGNTVNLNVVKLDNGALHVSKKDSSGNIVELPSVYDPNRVIMENADEFIDSYKAYLEAMKELNNK